MLHLDPPHHVHIQSLEKVKIFSARVATYIACWRIIRDVRTSCAGSRIVHDATRAGLAYNTSRELSWRARVWFATFFLTSTVWPQMVHNNTTHSPCNYQHWRTRWSKWIGRLPHSSFISQVVQCSLMTVDWRSRNGFKWSHRTWNIHNVHLDMWKFSFHSSAGTTFETKLLHQEHVLPV